MVAELLRAHRTMTVAGEAIRGALAAIMEADPEAFDAYVSTADGAALCGASQRTVQRWAALGRVGTQRGPSGDFLVNARDLLAMTDPKESGHA